MPETTDKQLIRILHLSDIHFRESEQWDADPVLRALTRFIGREVDSGLVPDLVAITGDIAFGGIAAEYALARQWLGALWPKFGGLDRDRLLLIPGNHDVDRSKVTKGVRMRQDALVKGWSQDDIAELLRDEDERKSLLKRHAAYLNFVNDWFDEPQVLPWWQRVIEIRSTKLHVAGLDSAWMACGDEDRGRLLLGRYQLTQIVMTEQAEAADWRIAMLHHPWDYLAEFDGDEARAAVHQHCDLLLRGHLHKPRPEHILPPDPSRGCLELSTGCVYETSQYPNAFQWIELLPGKRVRVHFHAWLHSEWTIDRNQPNCPEGHTDFDLGAKPSPPSVVLRAVVAEIPPAYYDWLRHSFEKIELLGAKEGRAVTLNHVYVPALTRRPSPPDVEKQSTETQTELQKPIPLLQRLDAESLYVPAAAGAGKSTFCRWAALQSIPGADLSHPVPAPESFAEFEPAVLRGRLPLLVVLREFWRQMDCGRGERTWHRTNLEKALTAWVNGSRPGDLSGDLLAAHLKVGSAFLLFDGVDEVPVSERRDNVTVYPRELLLSGLADALPAWHKAGNRILLTSRPYGLNEANLQGLGLPSAPLDPLPKELQDLFIIRWFHTLGKPEKTPDLIATIRGRGDLDPLVENPMLLTALCVLYDSGGRLPEDRYDLYKSIVNGVLHNRFPGDVRERDPVERRLEAVALGMHTGECAGAPRLTPVAEISWIEVERLLAEFARNNSVYEQEQVEAAVRREHLLNHSGLLVPRPNDRAAFYHLSFQEFLAARRLARTVDAIEQVFQERRTVAEWRPTLLFLFAAQIAIKDAQWGLGLLDRLSKDQDRAAVKANPAPAHFIAEAVELCLAKKYAIPASLKETFRRLSLDAIDDEIEVKARQALGLCLGRLGDPRIFDLRDPRAYVEVPAGRYAFGEKNKKVTIKKRFRIGRYPVTNSQYQKFVNEGGYTDQQWWSEDGWAWRQEERLTEPWHWRDQRWNAPGQPVVGVSFWEAEACATWAGGRLPTEQEWEAAARGPGGFGYPWGNDWANGICNTAEADLGVTSPVGLFPRSRQAVFGIDDLAGNVWEWCASVLDANTTEGRNTPRVLRGGSWDYSQGFARAARRSGSNPNDRNINVGFRVVCSSPSSEH